MPKPKFKPSQDVPCMLIDPAIFMAGVFWDFTSLGLDPEAVTEGFNLVLDNLLHATNQEDKPSNPDAFAAQLYSYIVRSLEEHKKGL